MVEEACVCVRAWGQGSVIGGGGQVREGQVSGVKVGGHWKRKGMAGRWAGCLTAGGQTDRMLDCRWADGQDA